jgi:hypothetical protein
MKLINCCGENDNPTIPLNPDGTRKDSASASADDGDDDDKGYAAEPPPAPTRPRPSPARRTIAGRQST